MALNGGFGGNNERASAVKKRREAVRMGGVEGGYLYTSFTQVVVFFPRLHTTKQLKIKKMSNDARHIVEFLEQCPVQDLN